MLQLNMRKQRVMTLCYSIALPSQRQAAASSPAWHGRPVSWSGLAYFLALELLPFRVNFCRRTAAHAAAVSRTVVWLQCLHLSAPPCTAPASASGWGQHSPACPAWQSEAAA